MFWKGGRLWEVVAYKGWSRVEVGLYKTFDEIEARQKYQKGTGELLLLKFVSKLFLRSGCRRRRYKSFHLSSAKRS